MFGDGELLREESRDKGREKQNHKGLQSTLRTEVPEPFSPRRLEAPNSG
jgi:hypothetical protein